MMEEVPDMLVVGLWSTNSTVNVSYCHAYPHDRANRNTPVVALVVSLLLKGGYDQVLCHNPRG